MDSIRNRLLRAFAVVVLIFTLGISAILLLHLHLIRQYQAISSNMITEYHLTDSVSNLISAYNTRFLSNDNSNKSSEAQVNAVKSQITAYNQSLDNSVTDPDSRANYLGLKNTINDVVQEINNGLSAINIGDYSHASDHYVAANKKYEFVKTNSSALLFSELKRASVLQAQANRSLKISIVSVIVALALIVAVVIAYVVRISRRIVQPLASLRDVTAGIAQGNMDATIDPRLLGQQDEVGSLAQSFNAMLDRLKEYIRKLNEEKASVEHKVEERTEELREAEAQLASSVQAIPLGFLLTDETNAVVTMNPAMQTIVQRADDPKSDKEDDPEILKMLLDESKATLSSIERSSNIFTTKNGRYLRILHTPVIDDQKHAIGVVTLVEDITEAKVLERSKDEFFSIASHELRTPLTAIRGNTSMIRDFYKEKLDDPDLSQMIDDIHDSSSRLIDIVNDFLDASRLEQGKMEFKKETFDVAKVVESVVYEMGALTKERKLYIHVGKTLGSLPQVEADMNRVKQILYNLTGNALKATEKGGITIEAVVEADHIKVSVTDTGTGIPTENQSLLFHKFQQASESILTRETSRSTGLGLYISRLLAENMGGELYLEKTEEGKGSTFAFTLPIAKSQES